MRKIAVEIDCDKDCCKACEYLHRKTFSPKANCALFYTKLKIRNKKYPLRCAQCLAAEIEEI